MSSACAMPEPEDIGIDFNDYEYRQKIKIRTDWIKALEEELKNR